MSTWILIWVVSLSGEAGYPTNTPVAIATGSAVFHSQKACEAAATELQKRNRATCFEDKQ